jgi:hypothetical protein
MSRRPLLALFASLFSLVLFGLASAEEKKEPDWTPLFNGKDFAGWDKESTSGFDEWRIADGILSTTKLGNGWLRTEKEFGDFELRLEFPLSARANSGVFLRADGLTPHVDGLEVQLLDDAGFPNGPERSACGALMLESGPTKTVSKKAGEWQTLQIRCEGPKVAVRLNGTLVVDEDLSKNTDREEAHPGRKSKSGSIGLQNRGELIDFRKIEVRTLKYFLRTECSVR